MKLFLITFSFFIGMNVVNAQTYWQQKVEYKINVALDDVTHTLTGDEFFVYHNNSPQTLTFIYMHLWPNAYQNGETALGKQLYDMGNEILEFGKDSILGNISGIDFKVNGLTAKWELDPKNPDICKLYLPSPLESGEKITVATPFKVKLPSGDISRLGHVGQSYQITQWYPKPAVFDKNGWNQMPYLTQGEFYSEFGSYDVSITLPKNYVVGSTGDLQNKEELAWLDTKVEESKLFMKGVFPKKKNKNNFPVSDSKTKTLRYIQENVHDFAWFADKRWLVLKGEVELPASKKKVTSWAMFTPQNAYVWKNSIEYINDGTYFYSKWNGDYPYNQVTAVDGTISAGGGMEYPNVTVIGNTNDTTDLEIVIVHEVGHNWFYGILGSNERLHGWMDEGMNTLNELRYIYTKYPNNDQLTKMIRGDLFHASNLSHYNMSEYSFRMIQSTGEDQPIETHSADFTSINYGTVMYMKTGLVFNYLKEYLGDELFDKCMHTYFEEWKFKHPQPQDMKNTLERVSGKKLDWLFGDLINTTKHMDVKLCEVDIEEGKTIVKVKNKGAINGPMEVNAYNNGLLVETQWLDPDDKRKQTVVFTAEVDEVRVNGSNKAMETNYANNSWQQKRLFGKIDPIKFQVPIGINENYKTNLFAGAAMGWNNYDKFMLGVQIHNYEIPFSPWNFMISPMYSFGGKRLSGVGHLAYTFLPSKRLKTSKFGIMAKSFKQNDLAPGNDNHYLTLSPFWKATIGNRKAKSPVSKEILIQGLVRNDALLGNNRVLVGGFGKYDFEFTRPDNKVKLELRADYLANAKNGNNLTRGNVAFSWSSKYLKQKNRWIDLRFFGGTFWSYDMAQSGNENEFAYNISGATGAQDVFTESYYFGRNETAGILSRQRADNMGDFKNSGGNLSTSNFGLTTKTMFAFNAYTQLPFIPKFIGLYADAGNFADIATRQNVFVADFGVGLKLKKVFAVYFPLWMTTNLDNSYASSKYAEKIRFTLNITLFNKRLNIQNLVN